MTGPGPSGVSRPAHPELHIAQTWTWWCSTCRDPEDPHVPGAYGDGDTYAEVAMAVAAHKREQHQL